MTDQHEQAMLAEARTEISYADHKASMVLAALGVAFGAVLGGLLARDWKPGDQGDGEWAWWVGCICALAAVASAALAVWPRYSKSDDLGVYYWGQIARLDSEAEMNNRLDKPGMNEKDRTRHQLWALSRIVLTKYGHIRRAFVLAGASTVLFAISTALA